MNTREKYAEMQEDGQYNYVDPSYSCTDSRIVADAILKADERKATPVFSGFLAYFADAVNEVARCSMAGQKQHAPDEPLQWHREKSGDELDALSRHLLEAGTMDDDSIRHSSKIAWRAMANLQKELELAGEAPLSKYNKI